ncbi:hypothetical protein [Halocatena halophila]|uniref:hypothetical protein n=1 Tax=Halocatena halophila TaxID=2814576 RepID=UPI002ED270D2
MGDRTASLLTKTQRRRIRNEFADLDEEKTFRDQQRIRSRVRSGLSDFSLLVAYPDRQLALLVEDEDPQSLCDALADTTIVVERLRAQCGLERAELLETAHDRVGQADDIPGRDEIDLRTVSEIRREIEAEHTAENEPGRWDRRANGLVKLGTWTFVCMLLVYAVCMLFGFSLRGTPFSLPYWGLLSIFVFCATGWLAIVATQALKHTVIPTIVGLCTHPREQIANAIIHPWSAIRSSWEEL